MKRASVPAGSRLRDKHYFEEKNFILDCVAVSSMARVYESAHPKLWAVIPPYNGQNDNHTRQYYSSPSVKLLLEKTGQNLKKSWHPQTLKNIERVWKAEQKHEAECKKIEELQKELRDERAREDIQKYAEDSGAIKKRDERLDWMYQGPGGQVNREEYLLGRAIDKQITEKYEEKEAGPSSETGLLPGSIFTAGGATSALDMAAKIREDPLFMIRKREEEKKREVLTNPVKMKKIKEMILANDARHRRDSTPPDHQRAAQQHRSRSHSPHKHSSRGSRREEPRERRGRSPSSSPPPRHSKHDKTDRKGKEKARSPSPKNDRHYRHQDTKQTKKLSAEELERRRREMMDFARWRDEERVNNIKRYKKEEEEEKELEKLDSRDGKFIHKMKLESASTSTLEDRVKRNIHSIQRTTAALEKNFMKR
ncbi:UNVERIFIED_CONTAM: hypothetical protein FKN15_020537 [Acipenser sinensis]